MLARHVGEVIQKHVQRVARFEAVEQRLNGNAAIRKHRRAAEGDFGSDVISGCGNGISNSPGSEHYIIAVGIAKAFEQGSMPIQRRS